MKGETFKYQMVSNGIMGEQINLRLSEEMLMSAKNYAKANGFGNVQELIKETLREKLFENKQISSKELALVKKLVLASEKNNLYSSEKELFRKLRRK
jgi:Arc/MetJ-type ribon-helix-helix transcriptional regulator